ncbi:MAG: hypothetical protein SGJ18_00295 [Pseudomonadota bacterium]|nr:hypothetical protein [Pseudomonadota bacterium]
MDLIKYSKSTVPTANQVHFVCTKDIVYKNIRSEAQPYGDLFKIEMAPDFFLEKTEV